MNQFVFKLPDLGEGVIEGEIVAWHVQSGDLVREDQPLVDVMTDKATVTIPSIVSGRVIKRSGNIGDVISVGNDLVGFETEADPSAPRGHVPVPHVFDLSAEPVRTSTRVESSVAQGTCTPLASPAVRRQARDHGVELSQVVGTGPGGRVTDADVKQYLASGMLSSDGSDVASSNGNGITEIPLAGLRRHIADKMVLSAKHIPHFTYIEEVDITELAKLRQHLNAQRSTEKSKVTYLPLMMLALVKAIRKHPQLNAHYDEQREVITQFEAIHLGIATQTERGLYVPVVRHVEKMDIWQATREMRRLAEATKRNTVGREELTGSTFTISSLGPLGGLAATPIINPPEVAILAVHKAEDRPVVRDGEIVIRHMINLSASFDHRVVDGANGAMLIQTLKALLENPATIFIGQD